MIQVNEDLTRKIADLARMEITPAEATLLTEQLKQTLGYVQKIAECDVTGVAPMTHPLDMATPMRDDKVEIFPADEKGSPKVLKHAPDVLYDGYKVPAII